MNPRIMDLGMENGHTVDSRFRTKCLINKLNEQVLRNHREV